MHIEPSSVPGLELLGPRAAEFPPAVAALLGREPDDVLTPALPFSVVVHNNTPRTVALLGIRFDMVGRNAKRYSVLHYADTLRHPEKASLTPGAARFVCAEPLYTDYVLRQAREIDRRGPMNLNNLRTVLRISASLDCAAFDDGQFAGPDTLGSFDRFETERAAELAFIAELQQPRAPIQTLLAAAMEIPAGHDRDRGLLARRVLARRLHEALAAGGPDEVLVRARTHRPRIALWRGASGG